MKVDEITCTTMPTAPRSETIWKQPKDLSERDWLHQSWVIHKMNTIYKAIRRTKMYVVTWKVFKYNENSKVKNSVYNAIPSVYNY